MPTLVEVLYVAAAGATAVLAFADAPFALLRARREGRLWSRASYHVANTISVVVIVAWLAGLALGWDASLPASLIGSTALGWIGLTMALPGFALALWARVTLGVAFVPSAARPADDRVRTEGPYLLVRHPFYLGLLVAMAGGVLALDSLVTLLALGVMAPLVAWIAALEEAHLVEELGPAYTAYQARVPRLVPWPRP